MAFCSSCGNKVSPDFIFCDKCGVKVKKDVSDQEITATETTKLACPYCSKQVKSVAKFCPECGKPLTQIKKCTKCGNFLARTSLFCGHCGEPVPKSCPKCGHIFQKEEKFCPKCGCSANATKPGSIKNPFDENPQPQNTFSTTETTSSSTPLCRVQEGKILAGVCSGLQAKFNLNAWIFRLLFIFTGIGLPIYIVLAIVLKYDDSQTNEAPSETNEEKQDPLEKIKTFVLSLYRLRNGKILAGVCTGIADKYKINAWLVRVIAVFSGIGLIPYIVLAIILKYNDNEIIEQKDSSESAQSTTSHEINKKKTAIIAGAIALAGIVITLVFVLCGKSGDVFVDTRDGQKYKTITFGPWTFMTENIRYNNSYNVCKTDDPTCEKHGRYYFQDGAALACPPGWKMLDDKYAMEKVLVAKLAQKYNMSAFEVLSDMDKIRKVYTEENDKAAILEFIDSEACIFDSETNDFTCGREYCSSEGACTKEYAGCLNSGKNLQCYQEGADGDGKSIKGKAAPIRCYKEMDEDEWLALPEVQKKIKKIKEEAAKKEAEERALQETAEKEAAERALQEAAEREAAERALQEAAERALQEAAEKEAAERALQEAAEKEAAERALQEAAEKEAAERALQEAAEKEAAERALQEAAERKAAEKALQEAKEQEATERKMRKELEAYKQTAQKEDNDVSTQSNSAKGIVKVASTKSIHIYYSGNSDIFSESDVNAFLKKNKKSIQSIYRNLLNSRDNIETVIRFSLTVNLKNGKIQNVEDISDKQNLAEFGHTLLFKQISVRMRNSWRLLPQNIEGTAVVEFPLLFKLQ
ncbi:phage shock protein C (PspC) family protein [Fibrobacter intestinalis]|uniref:Phage shock protein C (PspC) family protein n=1 Tax=Fibrobacter intestinalis TaxID=28122 RepID=A0A1M6Z4S5_9BACT|nr:PspC domain-containing protein [Fibrobacter intestinalis]SHL25481.1 phage shock protein C (PspC) family protein [Fibrobacter intestinalis]